MLESAERDTLLRLARQSIGAGLDHREPASLSPRTWPAPLSRHGAAFVSLHRGEVLRGCCGSLRASRPLCADVWHNAFASAFLDYRLPAVTGDELATLRISIAVLTPLQRLDAADEDALRATLRPGVDGVLLEYRGQHATFLPKVWEMLPGRGRFLAGLKQKAGLPAAFWSPECRWWRYQTEDFADADT